MSLFQSEPFVATYGPVIFLILTTFILVVKTFKILTAERVPSECNQSRYIADIFSKDIFIASFNILPIHWRYTADMCINLRCSTVLLQVVQSTALFLAKKSIIFIFIFIFIFILMVIRVITFIMIVRAIMVLTHQSHIL